MVLGKGVSSGIVIAKAYIIKEIEITFDENSKRTPTEEVERLKNATQQFIKNTNELIRKITANASAAEAGILEGHLEMLDDPQIEEGVTEHIQSGLTAEAAISKAFDFFRELFLSLDDELMSARATDLMDIKTGLLKILTNTQGSDVSSVTEECIVIKNDFTPSDTGKIDIQLVKGIIAEVGGMTSHTAIIARAMEIPAVLGVKSATTTIQQGDLLILDGTTGEIIVNPLASELAKAEEKIQQWAEEKQRLMKYRGLTSETADGKKVELFANIGGVKDLKSVLDNNADGIGLFRTELIFMDRTTTPTEEQQFEIYKEVAVQLKGKPVIIRTLDIGGDKDVPYLNLEKEDNPFLGYRAIRLCLDRKELFQTQIRALLRASHYGNIKIMIPMISTVTELRKTKAIIEESKTALKAKAVPFNENIEVGIMIETPAASLMADSLAKECDFFSIGTNDLTQYTMAVDRGNAKVAYIYNTFDPAVIRSIHHIVTTGKKQGIMVGMCGEAAGDPVMIPFLIGIGLDEYSMTASNILKAKELISTLSAEILNEKINELLALATAEEVKAYLEQF